MAHNSDYTHIWAESSDGINDWEVARALGRSSHDWGQLCGDQRWDDTLQQWVRVNAINKWARFKPICYNQHNELTDAQFKGKLSDNTNNIFFGLKIASNRTLSTDIGTWVHLHDATYTYIPPDGTANAPFRITDFTSIETPQTGYDSLAVPNPSGQFTTQQGYYTKSLDGIQAQYDPSNIRGVDLARILVPTQGSLTDVMSRTFPCILVSSPEDDEHYFTALDYDSGANPVPRPLYYGGTYLVGSWLANFNKPVYNSSLNPFRANTSGLKMTLFFIALPSSLYIDTYGHPCLDSGKQYDLYDNWFDVADMDGFIGPSIPVPFPNAINQNLTLVEYYAGVRVKAVDMLVTRQGSTIDSIGLTFAQEQMDSRTLSWSATIYAEYTAPTSGAGPSPAPLRTITGQTGGVISAETFDAVQDFGVFGGLQPGGIISGSIRTTVNDAGTTLTNDTHFRFTIQ